jgi:PST family polysaccharide transporter
MSKRGMRLAFLSLTDGSFLGRRPILAKVIRNFGWQSFDKIFRMGVGVFVSVMIVRYLGPDRFGMFSYALAFAGMFTSVAGLGLDGIVVREISKDLSRKDVILGTAFVMKLAGGAASFLIILAAIRVVKTHDFLLILITGIFALGLIFNSMDVVDFWFQSQIKAKYIVLARSSAFIASSVLKVIMVLGAASLVALSLATVSEAVLAAICLGIAYRLTGNPIRKWKPDRHLAKTLLWESWPLIISGFAVLIYMRIDQVMLGSMMDDRAVGIYAAAIKFSEVWYFIPTGISTSVFPLMVGYFRTDRALFFRKYQNIFNVMAGISVAIALVMTFSSTALVRTVYGRDFLASGPILAVHIWAGVFVFMGVAGTIWTMVNGYQKFALMAALAGLVSKIVLNLVMIPTHGTMGAAVSMVISQSIASYFIFAATPRTRKIFGLMTRAILLPWKYDRSNPAKRESR